MNIVKGNGHFQNEIEDRLLKVFETEPLSTDENQISKGYMCMELYCADAGVIVVDARLLVSNVIIYLVIRPAAYLWDIYSHHHPPVTSLYLEK